MDELTYNRSRQRYQQIGAEISQAEKDLNPTTGYWEVLRPNRVLGGYDVQASNGSILRGAQSDTNRILGRGTKVSVYITERGARIDTKPASSSDANSSSSQTGTSTGIAAAGFGGFGGTPTGTPNDSANKPFYRRGPDGNCTQTYGKKGKNDYDTLGECLNPDKTKPKGYACSGGTCNETVEGMGQYDSLAECEAAIVKPTFTGGQCNTAYTVIYEITTKLTPSGEGSGVIPGTSQGSIVLTGPVGGSIYAVPPSGSNQTIYLDGVIVSYVVDASGNLTFGSGSVVSVTRADGLLDDCGSAPDRCPT